jgi:transposase
MSISSKSPIQVLKAALEFSQKVLPEYSHDFSPQKFKQSQLFGCLVLKMFFKTDYRGIEAILRESPHLMEVLGLKQVPHFTTLQKAEKRILKSQLVRKLLEESIFLVLGKKRKVRLASVDSTGFEARHISQYFYRQQKRSYSVGKEGVVRKRFPKLSIIIDRSSHLILSAFGSRGPKPDIGQLAESLRVLTEKISVDTLLADAGYDSEANHERIRQRGTRSLIPPWHGRTTFNPAKGRWRRKMFFRFKEKTPRTYKQRWQVETNFSMIKRNLSASLLARSFHSQTRELLLKVLTHNAMIAFLFIRLFYRASHLLFLG